MRLYANKSRRRARMMLRRGLLSVPMLKKASPEFLRLYLELLTDAYAEAR